MIEMPNTGARVKTSISNAEIRAKIAGNAATIWVGSEIPTTQTVRSEDCREIAKFFTKLADYLDT